MSLFEEDEAVDEEPKHKQKPIITTDEFPMRVLAGAGTGKTFTMVRKVERLLRTDQVSPQNVLALTFTNKAADSMRTKLNTRIGDDGYDIDAYTYHSICHSILQEYPYYADLPSGFTIASDADKYDLAQTAVEAVPYQFVNPDGSYRDAPSEVLLGFISSMKQEGVRPDDLAAYLPVGSVLIELDEMTDRIERAAREKIRRRSLGKDTVPEFCDDLDAFSADLKQEQERLGSSPLEDDIRAYLQQLIETVEDLRVQFQRKSEAVTEGPNQAIFRLPAVLFSGYGTEGERMTRKTNFPAGIPKLPYTLLDRLREYLDDCKQAADLVHGYRAFEEHRQNADLVDFDDLIQKTVALLEDEEIAEEIAGQWDYVLCDEFQDTDAIQFELVTALAEHKRLFIVGDDDQAIYEWRGAESENIGSKLTAAYEDELTDMELELNFRSKQPILDLANNAITAVEGRDSDKELIAFGDKRDSTDGVAHIDITPPDEAETSDEEEYQAEQITTTVGGLLRGDLETAEEEYDLGDFAVLVRKKRHARPLIDAFSEAGIPFELVGDLSTESVGVETVLAYLRALATPSNDVSVRRVLLMRYRLSEPDLRQLAQSSERLIDAVLSVDPRTVSEPERLKTARAHFQHLLARRNSLSVEQLYHELLNTTNIEWFLTRTERRELNGLEELITDYGEPAYQPPIDEAFIEFLERYDSIVDATDSPPTEQTETASDAASFMTVHKAKGLDFPVVIMPSLTADEWEPQARRYSALVEAVDGTGFWETDQVKRDQQEARRVLHVGMTRAEEQLILYGQSDESTTDDDELSLEHIQSWLHDGIEWDLEAGALPIWEQIQSSLPATAEDWTEMVAATSSRRLDAVGTHAGEELAYEATIETILESADSLLDGSLSGGDPAAVGLRADAFKEIPAPTLRRRHSYTSLGTVETCARQHYLNHVVYAYELPKQMRVPVDEREDIKESEASQPVSGQREATNREIGILFHETAEAAIDQNQTERDEWRSVCEQLAVERDLEHALAEALNCVDRFFQIRVSEWDLLSAEHPFGIEIEGSHVVGEIDCVARRPTGELVVLDYKATGETKGETNHQLPLYLLACEELFDETITTAGYVYVSDIGPEVDLRTYDDERLAEAKTEIREGLQAAATSSYAEYTAGDHCEWCPHNELLCSAYQSDS